MGSNLKSYFIDNMCFINWRILYTGIPIQVKSTK